MQLLSTIDGEALMDAKFPKTKFCVETLLPDGICILGGAPKIGKSWWVLDLCPGRSGQHPAELRGSPRQSGLWTEWYHFQE